MSLYLSGERLYGDEFSIDEIAEWFRDEEEAYSQLGAECKNTYEYVYHALNRLHGFRYLPTGRIKHSLGIGSAYGDEFLPIASRIDELTILDPSKVFSTRYEVHGIPCRYEKPSISGDMSIDDCTIDLVTALGALHHIPNVSHIMKECYRCLRHGGHMMIREPIVSMGDWTRRRPGLTKRERGIPLQLFEQIVREAGFTVKHKALCMFPPISKLAGMLGASAYNNSYITMLDAYVCRLLKWNVRYHATNLFQKIRPSSIYFVLVK